MKYKGVENGTAVGHVHLCATCSYGAVIQGYQQTEALTLCAPHFSANAFPVPFEVSTCSSYLKRDGKNLQIMREIAWELKPGRIRTGFIKPGENEHSQKGFTT